VVPPFEPLGPHELAERWGISQQRVHQLLAEDDDMPRGIRLRGTTVWNLEDVEAYESRHPGRRKTPDESSP